MITPYLNLSKKRESTHVFFNPHWKYWHCSDVSSKKTSKTDARKVISYMICLTEMRANEKYLSKDCEVAHT